MQTWGELCIVRLSESIGIGEGGKGGIAAYLVQNRRDPLHAIYLGAQERKGKKGKEGKISYTLVLGGVVVCVRWFGSNGKGEGGRPHLHI